MVAQNAPPIIKYEESTRCLTRKKMRTYSLTCCGLQTQQGEETADQDCTLHDGCQENCDSHTDYIYRGRKVKGHAERGGVAQRGPVGGGAGWERWRCCRDSTRTSSWLSFLERSQLGPRHKCTETWLYMCLWAESQLSIDDNFTKFEFQRLEIEE